MYLNHAYYDGANKHFLADCTRVKREEWSLIMMGPYGGGGNGTALMEALSSQPLQH